MGVHGIIHRPLVDIQNIRAVLKGYGNDFQIIKELVQNAEDAGATILHIGWHPGYRDKENTQEKLLSGPALCMINDGPFKKSDEETICQMGMGSKAGDPQAIGRFGLGLKSVFKICEAFFYIASDINNPDIIRPLEFLNPWYGALHCDWDVLTDDHQTLVEQAIKSLIPARKGSSLLLTHLK